MVVVNLYAFEKTAAKPGVRFRGTHREHRHRRTVHDPLRRQEFSGRRHRHLARRLRRDRRRTLRSSGALSHETKWRLAQKAFATTAAYDSAIASTLERIGAESLQAASGSQRLPANPAFLLPQNARPALRRKSSPEGRHVLRRLRRRRRQRPPTAGQGTFLQQHRRPASRVGSRAGIRRAGRAPSSSTPIRAAPPPARRSPKPTSAPSNAIPSRPSVA